MSKALPSIFDADALNPWLVQDEIRSGGNWLGAGRDYLKTHIRGGDTIIWGSDTRLHLSGRELEELMLKVAANAVIEDRRKYSKERETERLANQKIAGLLLAQHRVEAKNWAFGIVLRSGGKVETYALNELEAMEKSSYPKAEFKAFISDSSHDGRAHKVFQTQEDFDADELSPAGYEREIEAHRKHERTKSYPIERYDRFPVRFPALMIHTGEVRRSPMSRDGVDEQIVVYLYDFEDMPK